MDYAADLANQRGLSPRDEGRMLNRLTRALVKVVVASIIVGTILAHFGITTDELIKTTGFSSDRVTEYARAGFAWALPNLMLGAVVIVPLWFLIYLFRPPGESRD
jgi:H+/Cl- antiporter ClcA